MMGRGAFSLSYNEVRRRPILRALAASRALPLGT